jgi:hypothetical protein
LRALDYEQVLGYATFMGKRMEALFQQLRPSVILSGFDAFHSSMALAVVSTIPTGLLAFCETMHTGDAFAFRQASPEALRSSADEMLAKFESQRLAAPTYLWENNLAMVIRRFPRRLAAFSRSVGRALMRRFDKFTQPRLRRSVTDYVRRKRNLILLPKTWLIDSPPDTPYLFIGLHQLDELRSLPGVRLVSPFASSREFMERAALVLCIQGTITQEAAMCRRPVIVFGETIYTAFPGVTKVERITDLPDLIRRKLLEPPPTRDAVVNGLMSYLNSFAPGCHNNWEVAPSASEIADVARQLEGLRRFLDRKQNARVENVR